MGLESLLAHGGSAIASYSRKAVKKATGPSLGELVEAFLSDLAQQNRSANTCQAYACDLRQFLGFHRGSIQDITPDVLRRFDASLVQLSPASRARKASTLASFLTWAYRRDYVDTNPMLKIDRVQVPPRRPRGLSRDRVERILTVIPPPQKRDRLLFRLLHETGLRIEEALTLHIEELEMESGDEHIRVVGKRGKIRRVFLDDPVLVQLLRAHLKQQGYQRGLLFRAQKNGTGRPLSYQAIQERWAAYCQKAGVECTLHQLRHSHATELVNDGVSLATIKKRLGHKSIQTTLLYAELSDATADNELRARRRKRGRI
jgi:site-specific recombinase XerD